MPSFISDPSKATYTDGISILDENNPYSIINRVPTQQFKDALKAIPPALLDKTEEELLPLAFPERNTNDLIKNKYLATQKLRINFWKEYEKATQLGRKVHLQNICNGVCTYAVFSKSVYKDSKRLAWILLPVADYKTEMEALNTIFHDRQKEIASVPFYYPLCYFKKNINCDGNGCDHPLVPDAKLMDVVSRVAEKVELRAHGSIIQKINETRTNKNLNLDGNKLIDQQNAQKAKTPQEIEDRIKEIERKLAEKNDSETINAEFSVEPVNPCMKQT